MFCPPAVMCLVYRLTLITQNFLSLKLHTHTQERFPRRQSKMTACTVTPSAGTQQIFFPLNAIYTVNTHTPQLQLHHHVHVRSRTLTLHLSVIPPPPKKEKNMDTPVFSSQRFSLTTQKSKVPASELKQLQIARQGHGSELK